MVNYFLTLCSTGILIIALFRLGMLYFLGVIILIILSGVRIELCLCQVLTDGSIYRAELPAVSQNLAGTSS